MKSEDISIARSAQYSLGNTATNILFGFVSMYLMFFYTNVMGLSGTVAGSVFMVARLVDAFTDPLMGIIVDRTNSKRFGKYRPYLLFATPLMGILFVLMFTTPNLGMDMKIVYAYVMYILYSLAWTAVQTPYLAMHIILSPNVDKRTRLVGIVQGIGAIAGLFTSVLVIPMLNAFGGQTNPTSWVIVCIILTVIFLVLFYTGIAGTGKYDKYQPPLPLHTNTTVNNDTAAPKSKIKDQITAVVKNPALIIIIISYATDAFAMQIGGALNMYFFRYNLNGRTDLIPILGSIGLPLSFLVMIILPLCAKKYGKKSLIIFFEIMTSFFVLLLLFASPKLNIPLIMIASIGSSCMFGFTNTLARAAVYDSANYAEWKLGVRANGLISSTFTFMNKFSQAISALVMGILLDKTGYSAQAATQAPETLNAILYMKTLIPLAAYIITVAAMVFYPLNKAKEQQMSQELLERREAVTD
jgi:sugar (glycoside-pentoside-hexuronide) transporter